MLISQALQSVAAAGPQDAAMLFLGKKIGYRDLLQDVARLSYLFQHEIGHEPRMALLTTGHPAVVKTIFALSNIKGVSIPLDHTATDEELGKWIRDSGATHLGITSDQAIRTRELMSNERLYLPVIELDKKRGGEYDSSFTAQPGFEPKESDPVLILRSGGNTKEPALAEFSHRELQFSATALRSRYHSRKTDRFLTQMPWAYPFVLVHSVLFPILTGATCVIDEGHENKAFLEFLKENTVTRIVGSPKYFRKMLVMCKNEQARLPQCVRNVIVGLGPLSPQLRKAFALMECPAVQVYGQLENTWTVAMEDTEEAAKADVMQPTLYRPLPGLQYKVLDPAGDAIEGSDERLGLLAVTGPTVMLRYTGPELLKKELEDSTRQAKRGTWLYTGDVARLNGSDDELTITFLGREMDAHLKEGVYHFADTIDAVIQKVQGVEDGAAFFMENAVGRTILACAVIKRPKVTLNDQDVLQACRAVLDESMVPRVAFFTDSIPRDTAGNINRYRLRRQYAGTLTG